MLNRVVRSIERLDDWLGHNGWAGYDPYDILEYLYNRYRNNINLYEKIQRRLIQELEIFYPWQVRRFLSMQKSKCQSHGTFRKFLCEIIRGNKRREISIQGQGLP